MTELAFPTAEGYGAHTTHARGVGATVYVVTNLNDSGSGSFREACEASGLRYVMFAIGGTIDLLSDIILLNGNIYIAGQSCPADSGGILLRDYHLTVRTRQVCIRFIRVRVGLNAVDGSGRDTNALGIVGSTVEKSDIILDHCDATWSTDQNQDVSSWSNRVTVQWCSIGEGTVTGWGNNPATPHNKGGLYGSEPWMGQAGGGVTPVVKTVTSHHNWYHSTADRCPTIQMFGHTVGQTAYGNPTMIFDARNNMIFNNPNNAMKLGGRFYTQGAKSNWIAATSSPRHCLHANVVGCLMLPGAGPNLNNPGNELIQLNPMALVYARNNRGYKNILGGGGDPNPYDGLDDDAGQNSDNGVDAVADNYLNPGAWSPTTAGNVALAEFSCPPVATDDVDDLQAIILANTGCIYPMRDSVLDRWIAEVGLGLAGGNVEITHDDYPILAAGTSPTRSQPDGIEDSWKTANGFSNSTDYSGVTDPGGSGYDVVELYLNSLVGEVVSSASPLNVFPVGAILLPDIETIVPGLSVVDTNNPQLLQSVRLRLDNAAVFSTIDTSGGGSVG